MNISFKSFLQLLLYFKKKELFISFYSNNEDNDSKEYYFIIKNKQMKTYFSLFSFHIMLKDFLKRIFF